MSDGDGDGNETLKIVGGFLALLLVLHMCDTAEDDPAPPPGVEMPDVCYGRGGATAC